MCCNMQMLAIYNKLTTVALLSLEGSERMRGDLLRGNFSPHIIIIIMTYTVGKFHASHYYYYYNDLY